VMVGVEVGNEVGVGPRVRVGISAGSDAFVLSSSGVALAGSTSRASPKLRQEVVSRESRVKMSRDTGIGLLFIIADTDKIFRISDLTDIWLVQSLTGFGLVPDLTGFC
jgi:hypothetical protein